MMRESAVQRGIRRHLESHGWAAIKTQPGLGCPVGFPDLIAMRPDRPPVLIEVKSRIGRLSAPQAAMHARLKRQGYQVIVARSVNDVMGITG